MDPDFPDLPRPLPDVYDPTRSAADIVPPGPVAPEGMSEHPEHPPAEQPAPQTGEPDPADVPIWMS